MEKGQILYSKRSTDQMLGGLWEFPGGLLTKDKIQSCFKTKGL